MVVVFQSLVSVQKNKGCCCLSCAEKWPKIWRNAYRHGMFLFPVFFIIIITSLDLCYIVLFFALKKTGWAHVTCECERVTVVFNSILVWIYPLQWCTYLCVNCEPVWPSDKALGWYTEGPQFESALALLSLQKLCSVDTVLWLCTSQL